MAVSYNNLKGLLASTATGKNPSFAGRQKT